MFMIKGKGSQIPKKEIQFYSDELNSISLSLSHRYKIEDVLNKFVYQGNKKYA